MTIPLWAWLVTMGVAFGAGALTGLQWADAVPAIKRRWQRFRKKR